MNLEWNTLHTQWRTKPVINLSTNPMTQCTWIISVYIPIDIMGIELISLHTKWHNEPGNNHFTYQMTHVWITLQIKWHNEPEINHSTYHMTLWTLNKSLYIPCGTMNLERYSTYQKMTMSSRYIRQCSRLRYPIHLSINLWKVTGALHNPKGVQFQS